jgi:hypothetical protein
MVGYLNGINFEQLFISIFKRRQVDLSSFDSHLVLKHYIVVIAPMVPW